MALTAGSTSSTDPKASAPGGTTQIAVGRIVGAHGLQGRLRVRLFETADENAAALTRIRLGASEDDASARSYEVASIEPGRPGEARMTLEGVSSREAAEELRGMLVLADPRNFVVLPEGEYYGYQLVGCRVESSQGAVIGTVRDVWSTGAPDVLVVEGENGRQQLIPAAEELLQEIDLEARRIVVEVVPGLLSEEPDGN